MDGVLPTQAHRLFFVMSTSRTVFELSANGYWAAKLGEPSDAVFRRCIDAGLIATAVTQQILDRGYKMEELKPLLKARGIKSSGKKAEMIDRLIVSDPDWCKSQTNSSRFYVRTPDGQRLAEEICDGIGREKGKMEMRLTLLIHDGRYEEAFRTWTVWDEDEVFPRDEWLGIDNRETNPNYFVEMAHRIEKLLPVGKREQAILNFLYGRVSYEPDMLAATHAASYERDLIAWREAPFVVGIRIEGPNNGTECSFARLYEGCYRLEDAPDYPFGPCDNEPCCVCFWSLIGDDETAGVEWKVPEHRHPMSGPRKISEFNNRVVGDPIRGHLVERCLPARAAIPVAQSEASPLAAGRSPWAHLWHWLIGGG
jgi:hypothetical protein